LEQEAISEQEFHDLVALCQLIAEEEMKDPLRESPRKKRKKPEGFLRAQRHYRDKNGNLQPPPTYSFDYSGSSRWSDKTLIQFDELANQLRKRERYADLHFTFLEAAADGTVKEVKCSGAWTIVDNGYLQWSVTTIPPMKLWESYPQMRFSKWLESLRKDVECTFGIMKGRFRILKTGVPLHGIEVCDGVWLKGCALHNLPRGFLQ